MPGGQHTSQTLSPIVDMYVCMDVRGEGGARHQAVKAG